ncbi:hypothetical protein [Pedobacter terrae]
MSDKNGLKWQIIVSNTTIYYTCLRIRLHNIGAIQSIFYHLREI